MGASPRRSTFYSLSRPRPAKGCVEPAWLQHSKAPPPTTSISCDAALATSCAQPPDLRGYGAVVRSVLAQFVSNAPGPVARQLFRVGKRDDPDLPLVHHEDDRVRETRHKRAARTIVKAIARKGRRRQFDSTERRVTASSNSPPSPSRWSSYHSAAASSSSRAAGSMIMPSGGAAQQAGPRSPVVLETRGRHSIVRSRRRRPCVEFPPTKPRRSPDRSRGRAPARGGARR